MADDTRKQPFGAVERWARKGVTAPEALLTLQGAPLQGGHLRVEVGPPNRVGAHLFRLWWESPTGEVARPAVVEGLHHRGPYPATCWVEVMALPPEVQTPSHRLALEGEALVEVFRLLGRLLPPGGHMMVEYEAPHRQATRRALERGAPPEETPLGRLLVRAGFTGGFRDWYFAEGWTEGPRKLQAFLPLVSAPGPRGSG
ncbi:hypothetical protein HRbin23_00806 [bacterium HR23]|nr:hypothetical protein HRbin23_00806 [bacterium HR23]